MRYKFTMIVALHPLSVAEMRERTLREQLNAYLASLSFSVNAGVESTSKNRIDLKRCPRVKNTTHHKRAKPRDHKYLKNDARAHVRSAKK